MLVRLFDFGFFRGHCHLNITELVEATKPSVGLITPLVPHSHYLRGRITPLRSRAVVKSAHNLQPVGAQSVGTDLDWQHQAVAAREKGGRSAERNVREWPAKLKVALHRAKNLLRLDTVRVVGVLLRTVEESLPVRKRPTRCR